MTALPVGMVGATATVHLMGGSQYSEKYIG